MLREEGNDAITSVPFGAGRLGAVANADTNITGRSRVEGRTMKAKIDVSRSE
jgi:hypothetical protein